MLVEQRALLRAWPDDSVLFPAGQIQVQSIEPKRVGLRPGPIDADRIAHREQALIAQPGVQVHRAIERRESMIGHDHQFRGWRLARNFADGIIDGAVKLKQLRIVLPPQDMRVLIDRGKIEKQKTAGEAMQGFAKQALLIGEHQPAGGEKLIQIEDALAQCGGVLRDSRAWDSVRFPRRCRG